MRQPTIEEIKKFCVEHGVSFYKLGTPDDWNDTTKFRAASNTFPVYGINVPMALVVNYFDNPPYLGEGI